MARPRFAFLLAIAPLFLVACARPEPVYPGVPVIAQLGPSGVIPGYRLPVNGRWLVLRTHYGNTRDQAYAVDIVLPTPEGKAASGSGKQNTDYPSYGQPILADAQGVVVIAVDGVPDNAPGVVNAYDQHGNYVVIDHQNGEFSLMAHLIPSTLRVHPGQVVTAGTELGRCGNSGHTTMPHLHWQVMTSAHATQARGVQQRYLPYDRNGQLTTTIPDKGDFITPR
jgi:murein DD-endopeptidase MepM/ murein hydrolase activator NlpD